VARIVAGTVLAFARALGELVPPDVSWKYSRTNADNPSRDLFCGRSGRYEASLSLGAGNLSYFFDGSHRREFWSDSRRSVAVKARGGKREQEKQGNFEPLWDKGRWENLTPKRPKGLIVDIQKQLLVFLETFIHNRF